MDNANRTFNVETRVIGKRKLSGSPWHVALPPELSQSISSTEDLLLLRNLIEYLVREEVRAFRLRQEERRLLHVLSPLEMANAAVKGKIAMGGDTDNSLPGQNNDEVDEDEAVQIALQGFLDGLYMVFLDGQQMHNLDVSVELHVSSTLLFLRLVALAGG